MSVLAALARAQAAAAGVAQPLATVRHVHLHHRPLVLVPLTLAGEANAPLAALVGTDRDRPQLLVVPQPRNRDQRFRFAAALAEVLVGYVESCCAVAEAVAVDRGRDVRFRFTDAPQVLVPNPGGVQFVRLFGRSTRFRRTDGEYPVPPAVPLLGRWLTFLANQAEVPGSATLVAVTDALALHWATGQSAVEDAHLGALLAWIDPPPGSSGAAAALAAEDPAVCPPAGPATDPGFDNTVLAPLVTGYAADGDPGPVERALRTQLEPTWRSIWRAVDLLRELPAGSRVAGRWDADRDAFSAFVERLREGAPPQPRRDGAVAAAARLHRLENAHARYAVQRAFDDPLVMAEHLLTGEAFVGTVALAKADRVDDSGRRPVLRPRVMLHCAEPVRLDPGTQLTSPARPGQKATVVSVATTVSTAGEDRTEVLLELSGGMGRRLVAEPGSVPQVGERLLYTTLSEGFRPGGAFPEPERTPWTHGGPPVAPETADAQPAGVAPAGPDGAASRS